MMFMENITQDQAIAIEQDRYDSRRFDYLAKRAALVGWTLLHAEGETKAQYGDYVLAHTPAEWLDKTIGGGFTVSPDLNRVELAIRSKEASLYPKQRPLPVVTEIHDTKYSGPMVSVSCDTQWAVWCSDEDAVIGREVRVWRRSDDPQCGVLYAAYFDYRSANA